MHEPDSLALLVQRAAAGDEQAVAELLGLHRDQLTRMVQLRLDTRLRGRVDPEDIVQETLLEAMKRLPDYAREPTLSFPVWLRFLAGQKLVDAMRHHLGVQKR